MNPQTAFVLFFVYLLWMFRVNERRRTGISTGLWAVTLWVILIGSRPVSTWFSGGASGASSYDEGNAMERMVYFVLILGGLYLLNRRRVRLRTVIDNNPWFVVFCAFWALSFLWSDAPVVALKRWIKDLGNVVMVLVILTERNPVEATKAVFTRCACLLVPISIMLILYFGDLGRTYHVWSGEMMYTGVTTHKNSLGVLALVCGLMLLWDFTDRRRPPAPRRDRVGVLSDLSLLGMTLWLLIFSHSASSLACMAAGATLFFLLGRPGVQARVVHLGTYVVLIGGGLWILNSVFNVTRFVIVDLLGRDMTLTTRTDVWPALIAQGDGALLGSGFKSYWTGERLAVLYEEYGIIQAHNGYLDTYLNGGIVALVLLLIFLVSAFGRLKRELARGQDFARIKLIVVVVTLAYNFTEAFFNKQSILWFALLLAAIAYPLPAPRKGEEEVPAGSRQVDLPELEPILVSS